jgi:hypothetical protein
VFEFTDRALHCSVFVPLTYTPSNFGGRRPWFVCPSPRCGRRVAILYLADWRRLHVDCRDEACGLARSPSITAPDVGG